MHDKTPSINANAFTNGPNHKLGSLVNSLTIPPPPLKTIRNDSKRHNRFKASSSSHKPKTKPKTKTNQFCELEHKEQQQEQQQDALCGTQPTTPTWWQRKRKRKWKG
jgi:hypothetical protein